jgi:hypothetical protein
MVWQQLFTERFGSLGRFQLGQTVDSPLAADLFAKSSRTPGIRIFERDIRGELNGEAVEGKLFALVGQTNFGSLIIYPSALLAPKGRLGGIHSDHESHQRFAC